MCELLTCVYVLFNILCIMCYRCCTYYMCCVSLDSHVFCKLVVRLTCFCMILKHVGIFVIGCSKLIAPHRRYWFWSFAILWLLFIFVCLLLGWSDA